ncbi:serine hydrolase domain-containing protein [Novipirellula rosea]|uniref:Beta-lactamase-related domain-containing protein n=1 Tax=Novipirellula rosea TaxID=1031540 RepID=A0ABP8MN12_9BACT
MRRVLPVTGGIVFVAMYFALLSWSQCLGAEITKAVVSEKAEQLVQSGVVDGLSIGFIQDDRHGTYHFGTSRRGKRPDNLTVYEIGSASKVFTSLLLADATVRGSIDLSDPVDVTNGAGIELPKHGDHPITWLHISTHRSGLPRLPANIEVVSPRNPYHDFDAKKAAAFLSELKLTRSPAAQHEYSNFAVSVLGYLIAQHQHSSYSALLKKQIADPLRMDNCTIELSTSQQQRLAMSHRPAGVETPLWDFADLPGAGGIRASLRDMMRFARAQLYPPSGTLGEAIELAWQQHHTGDESGPAMGLSWMILPDGQTRWHNGETGGSHSIILVNRRHRVAVILLSNTAPGPHIDALGIGLMRHATTSDAEPKIKPFADGIDPKRLEGRYQLAPNFIFDVHVIDGRMTVGITDQPAQQVFRDFDTKWSYKSVEATLEFHLTGGVPAYALTLHQNGIAQRAIRIRE